MLHDGFDHTVFPNEKIKLGFFAHGAADSAWRGIAPPSQVADNGIESTFQS